MKIYYITNLRLPNERGVSYGVVTMCQALAQTGNKIELVIPRCRPVAGIKNNIWDYHKIKKNSYSITHLFHLELPETSILEGLFSHLRYGVMIWSFSIVAFIYLWRKQAEKIHLFNDIRELLFILKIFSWAYRPLIVFELHMLPIGNYENLLEKLSFDRIDLLLVTTIRFRDYYKNFNVDDKKILVFPNGVNINNFDYLTSKIKLRKQLGLPLNSFIVGYGGRFITMGMEKGIPELISVVSKLRVKYKNLLLVCVGGPQDYVEKYRKKSSEDIFVGDVPQNILYKYLRSFDICAMPFPWTEHYAYNMSPLKMFEYMASKNPIIATDLPSIREILTEGQNALLAKPGDVDSLSLCIEKLLSNKKLGEKISKMAFTQVSQKYTWEKRAKTEVNSITGR